jgi:hypothetical protein
MGMSGFARKPTLNAKTIINNLKNHHLEKSIYLID